MGQVLHGSATTTEAVRRAIQNSEESLRGLAKRYGINQKTVAKWKKRSSVASPPACGAEIDFIPGCRFGGVRSAVKGFQPHSFHQCADVLAPHLEAFSFRKMLLHSAPGKGAGFRLHRPLFDSRYDCADFCMDFRLICGCEAALMAVNHRKRLRDEEIPGIAGRFQCNIVATCIPEP